MNTILARLKNSFIKSTYYSICEDYGVNADETCMKRDWFYTTKYGNGGDGGKTTKRSPPDNLTWWIITKSRFYKKKYWKDVVSRCVRGYIYLVLTPHAQARSSIVGNSESALDAQQVFESPIKSQINEDYSISADTDRYQNVLEHALSKAVFSIRTGTYMLPSD